MSRKILNKQNIDIPLLKLDKCDQKSSLLWTSSSDSEGSYIDGRSEILWSRDKSGAFNEHTFFKCFQDDFSDLTERTTSSCSWHNDDFDMNTSSKFQASIEAIEDALYDQQVSPLISKNVFEECCDWAKKFPFLRLKGKQIVKPVDDGVISYETLPENHPTSARNGSFCLQVEGKKMAIHVSDKFLKKSFFENIPEMENPPNYEEVLDDDGEYEECLALDTGWDTLQEGLTANASKSDLLQAASIESLHEKIVEQIALEMWPKVLEHLQKDNSMQTVVSAVFEHQKVSLRRPRTEGTELSVSTDFPKLGSILSISPKVLQTRKYFGSWRGSLRPSRPNSEIPFIRKNHTSQGVKSRNEELKETSLDLFLNNSQHAGLIGTKLITKEDNLYLPALDEDIQDSNFLTNLYEEPDSKEAAIPVKSLSRKSESFLPPIDGKSIISSNAKLTQNLFTLFGPSKKFEKSRRIGSAVRKPSTPASRPNTSASRKVMKQTGNHNYKNVNERLSSMNSTKKSSESACEKQVTLFPIVTSLIPCKERNSSAIKKGFQNSLGAKKR